MPISLCINTATIESTVCLCKDGKVLATQSWNDQAREAEKLLPAISEMMSCQNLEIADLDHVLVIQGPGSFTAIRVGIVTANSIVQNSDKVSLHSLTTFELIKKMTEAEYDLVALNGGGKTLITDDGQISTIRIDDFNQEPARRLLADLTDVQKEALDEKFEILDNLLKFDQVCARITASEEQMETLRTSELPLLPYYVKKPSIS